MSRSTGGAAAGVRDRDRWPRCRKQLSELSGGCATTRRPAPSLQGANQGPPVLPHPPPGRMRPRLSVRAFEHVSAFPLKFDSGPPRPAGEELERPPVPTHRATSRAYYLRDARWHNSLPLGTPTGTGAAQGSAFSHFGHFGHFFSRIQSDLGTCICNWNSNK